MTDLRGDITKLVIFPDDKAKVDDKGTRPRVLSTTGAAYYNGYGESTTKDEAEAIEKDKDKDKGDGSGGGGGSGTGSPDAGDKLAVGDEVPGFDNLQDCDTGQCVHANFTGQAVVPPGWKSECDDGTEEDPSKRILYYCYSNGHHYVWHKSEVKSLVMSDLKRGNPSILTEAPKTPGIFFVYRNQYEHYMEELSGKKEGSAQISTHISDGGSAPGIVEWRYFSWYIIENPNISDLPEYKPEWPSDMCSEVVFDKDNGTFAPSCAKYDKNLPASVNKEQTKLELCDKDGNKVIIKNTLLGLEITQEKYGITSLIDRDSHKVISQTLTENTVIH